MRGREFNLPTGQEVAIAMKVQPLPDDQILVGTAEDGNHPPSIVTLGKVFAGNCPLWTYILAEAMQYLQNPPPVIPVAEANKTINTPQLGSVGGRIVAEVFLGLMFADSESYLSKKPDWHPPSGVGYRLKDFVRKAWSLSEMPG